MRGMMVVLVAAALLQAQQPSPLDDLLQELVARIASAVPAGTLVHLDVVSTDAGDDVPSIEARVSAQLNARGCARPTHRRPTRRPNASELTASAAWARVPASIPAATTPAVHIARFALMSVLRVLAEEESNRSARC